MVQGPTAGPKLTMTSRLFLRRFMPRVVVQIEADVEAQQIVEALAACPNQTAVESDMKVGPSPSQTAVEVAFFLYHKHNDNSS